MDQTLRRKLDQITDILWAGGVTNPVTYIEQISYLIYLKLLDEEETTRELQGRLGAGNRALLFPAQAERFRWSKWRFKSGEDLRNFVRDEVFPYMASLVKDDPQVAEYFRDAVLEILDPNVLKQVIDMFDSIDFRKLGPDIKGDIFEIPAHPSRTVRTERPVSHPAPDPRLHGRDDRSGPGRHRVRPGLRHGWFSHRCRRSRPRPLQRGDSGSAGLRGGLAREAGADARGGEEGDPQSPDLPEGAGREDTRLEPARGIDLRHRRVAPDDADLRHESRAPRDPPCPPQARQRTLRDERTHRGRPEPALRGDPLEPAFCRPDPQGLNSPGSANKIEKERAVVHCPDAALPGAGGTLRRGRARGRTLRLDEGTQGTARKAPAGVRVAGGGITAGRSVQTVRRRQDLRARPAAPGNGAGRGSGRDWAGVVLRDPQRRLRPRQDPGGGRPETPEKNDIPGLLSAWNDYKESRFEKPPGEEAGALLDAGSDEPGCWWASFETLAENDYNLAASRYKPRVAEPVPDEDPGELIREVLAIEREITQGLEKLLEEVEQ